MATGGSKTSAIINVTPLIDVVMVLLIVFMILPSKTVGLRSDLPQQSTDNQPAPPNPLNLVLTIGKDGAIAVNSQPIELAQLETRLKELFAVRPDGVLFIDGARELDFADVAAIIDIAHGAKVGRIGILTAKN